MPTPPDTTSAPVHRVAAAQLEHQLCSIFTAWGFAPEPAVLTARTMVQTDLWGIDSHGVGMLGAYQLRRLDGRIQPRPQIRVIREGTAGALIDADRSIGHPPSVLAMDMAIAKARAHGIGAVGVVNSNHHGAAGCYAMQAVQQGVIGLAFTSAPSTIVAPTFGRQPMYGTNPIAFGAPANKHAPFLFDAATSTVAYGKVSVARRKGTALPDGWAQGPDGETLNDPNEASLDRVSLTPLGGTRTGGSHKGYGLAMMVEILCSSLTGGWISGRNPGSGPYVPSNGASENVGHFFIAIDPAAFVGAEAFGQNLDGLIDLLHGTLPRDPDQPVMVAGEPEHRAQAERSRDGIPLTAALLDEVRAVCTASGVAFELDAGG